MPGAPPLAVVAALDRVAAGAAVDRVDEHRHRLARLAGADLTALGPFGARVRAAAAEVDRQRPHPLLVGDRRGAGTDLTGEVGPIGGDQLGIGHRQRVAGGVADPGGADQPRRDRARQLGAGKPPAGEGVNRHHQQTDQQHEPGPLHRRLPALAAHAATLPAASACVALDSTRFASGSGEVQSPRGRTASARREPIRHGSEGLGTGRRRDPLRDPDRPELPGGQVDFLFIHTTTPLILALLIAGALGALIGWAAPHVRRGRRNER